MQLSALLIATFASSLAATTAGATPTGDPIPRTLTYQARLLDANGDPVDQNNLAARFRLYASASGGTALHDEPQTIQVSSGLVAVVLGDDFPFDTGLFDTAPLFLGVTFGTDPEMTPRLPVTAVPTALRSRRADDVPGADITPNSISINGQLIIDASGNWVGDPSGLLAPDSVGSSQIVDGEVKTAEIGDAAVTSEKLGTGAVLSSKIADGAVSSTKIAGCAIDSSHLCTDAVDHDEIKKDAVRADEIKKDAVGEEEIAKDAVRADEIKKDAVGEEEIAKDAVRADEIKDGTVGSAEIADGSVGSAEIATDAVGAAELQDLLETVNDVAPVLDVVNLSTVGKRNALRGRSHAIEGRGVQGNHLGSGAGMGVRGGTQSSSGYGVFSGGDFGGTGAKYFLQPHPTDPARQIRFACLEGPESGTYFRGSAVLSGGFATIEVPESFRLASEEAGLTVQLTAYGPSRAWVQQSGTDVIVVAGEQDVRVDYFVQGVRRGFASMEVFQDNHAFVPEVRGEPYGTQYPLALRRILVDNGTLNPDFTPNEATAAALGWPLGDPEGAR